MELFISESGWRFCFLYCAGISLLLAIFGALYFNNSTRNIWNKKQEQLFQIVKKGSYVSKTEERNPEHGSRATLPRRSQIIANATDIPCISLNDSSESTTDLSTTEETSRKPVSKRKIERDSSISILERIKR